MPPHTVAASARSLRFLDQSTRLLRTFGARSLRTHIELRAHGCRAVDASAHGCGKRTVATIPRTLSARSLRFLEHSAHGRYETLIIQHTAVISVPHTVATAQRTAQHTAVISVLHTVATAQRTA